MLSTYATLNEREKATKLCPLLDKIRRKSSYNSGWGYYFDWQNRVFFIPRFIPTVVNTSFIVNGLLECYRKFGDIIFLELALSSEDFFLNRLNYYKKNNGEKCVSYTPIDNAKVHNANLLAAHAMLNLSLFSKDNNEKLKRKSIDRIKMDHGDTEVLKANPS